MDRAALDPRDTRIWIRRDQTVAGEECGFPAGEGHRTTCVNQTLRAYHTASRNRQPGGAAEMTLKRVGEDFVVMRHRRIRQGSSGGKGKVNDPSCGSLSADLALIKGAYAEERLSRLGTVGPCASLHPELGSNGTPSQGRKKNQNRHKGCGNRTRSTRNTTISGFVRREVRGTRRAASRELVEGAQQRRRGPCYQERNITDPPRVFAAPDHENSSNPRPSPSRRLAPRISSPSLPLFRKISVPEKHLTAVIVARSP
jgi:hypothetical protein